MRWALSADTFSVLARNDPMPFLRGMLWTHAKRRLLTTFARQR
jgi:hypothetical protein